MKIASFIFILLFVISCATRTKETDRLSVDRGSLPETSSLDIPFIKQEKFHCGPATVAMVLKHSKIPFSMKELSREMYTVNAKGTFQTELISTIRSKGLLPIPIRSLTDILKEASAGNPVIVFQNLGFSTLPNWHYAVVTGHDLDGPDIMLHSGENKNEKSDMRLFERSWILGGKWAVAAITPGNLSQTANELTHVDAAASLEAQGQLDAARISYETILTKWPMSLPARLGLGNIYFEEKNYVESLKQLRLATKIHPDSPLAWHNRAFVENASGNKQNARMCSEKTLKLSDGELKQKLELSLRDIM